MKYIFFLLLLFGFGTLHAQLADKDHAGTADEARSDSSCEKRPTLQYFSVGVKYPESSEALLKKVRMRQMLSSKGFTGSGFILFHFTVDCTGHTSDFLYDEFDRNYNSCTFDKDLVQLLLDFVKSLDQWPKAHLKDGTPVRYNYYLTFWIKDGSVVTVSP